MYLIKNAVAQKSSNPPSAAVSHMYACEKDKADPAHRAALLRVNTGDGECQDRTGNILDMLMVRGMDRHTWFLLGCHRQTDQTDRIPVRCQVPRHPWPIALQRKSHTHRPSLPHSPHPTYASFAYPLQ